MRWWDSIRQLGGHGLTAAAEKGAEFFRTRRKRALACLALGVLLVTLCIIVILVSTTGNARNAAAGDTQTLDEIFSPRTIPPEEFFLPEEPDFLPETLPEREKRESWTAEDAEPFWTDPVDEGAGVYVDLMSTGIDDLMERVP
jgi:hypothetical protein